MKLFNSICSNGAGLFLFFYFFSLLIGLIRLRLFHTKKYLIIHKTKHSKTYLQTKGTKVICLFVYLFIYLFIYLLFFILCIYLFWCVVFWSTCICCTILFKECDKSSSTVGVITAGNFYLAFFSTGCRGNWPLWTKLDLFKPRQIYFLKNGCMHISIKFCGDCETPAWLWHGNLRIRIWKSKRPSFILTTNPASKETWRVSKTQQKGGLGTWNTGTKSHSVRVISVVEDEACSRTVLCLLFLTPSVKS